LRKTLGQFGQLGLGTAELALELLVGFGDLGDGREVTGAVVGDDFVFPNGSDGTMDQCQDFFAQLGDVAFEFVIFILEGLVTFIVGGFGYVFGANNVKLMAIIKP